MAKTYHFKGGYIQISNKIKNPCHIYKAFYVTLQVFIFGIVLWFTDYIFSSILSTRDYYEIFSLGAVFATIGSSLISITSLSCNHFFEEYKKAKEILLSYNNNLKTVNTWDFVQDNKVLLNSVKHNITYKKIPTEVVFEFGVSTLPVFIPTNKKELIYWRLIINLIKMRITEKLYFKRLEQNSTSLEEGGLFVWECTTYMLKSALLYKISLSLTILGGMFYIAGLIAIFIRS